MIIMKHLDQNQTVQLLSIIDLYPAIRIMHFSDDNFIFNQKIVSLCEEHEYEFQLNCTTNNAFNSASQEFGKNRLVHIKEFNLNQPRYAIQAKMYDYIFVSSHIIDDIKDSFLKKSHGVIKNAGLIIIFVPKDREQKRDYQQVYLWSQLLEENYFVATSTIDVFDDYDIIISKKMHGWGG